MVEADLLVAIARARPARERVRRDRAAARAVDVDALRGRDARVAMKLAVAAADEVDRVRARRRAGLAAALVADHRAARVEREVAVLALEAVLVGVALERTDLARR